MGTYLFNEIVLGLATKFSGWGTVDSTVASDTRGLGSNPVIGYFIEHIYW